MEIFLEKKKGFEKIWRILTVSGEESFSFGFESDRLCRF